MHTVLPLDVRGRPHLSNFGPSAPGALFWPRLRQTTYDSYLQGNDHSDVQMISADGSIELRWFEVRATPMIAANGFLAAAELRKLYYH